MLTSLSNMELARFLPGFDYSQDYVAAIPGNDYIQVEHRKRSIDADYNFDQHNLLSYNQPQLTQATHSYLKNSLYHPVRTEHNRIVILNSKEDWVRDTTYFHILGMIHDLLIREMTRRHLERSKKSTVRLTVVPDGLPGSFSDVSSGHARCLMITMAAEGCPAINRIIEINRWVNNCLHDDRHRSLIVDVLGRAAKFEYDPQ